MKNLLIFVYINEQINYKIIILNNIYFYLYIFNFFEINILYYFVFYLSY